MQAPIRVTDDIHVLPSHVPFPGFGVVPVNAFVLKAKQPVLIDSGLHQDRNAFIEALGSVIDPSDLRWLWLTHPDQDHVGSMKALLDMVPDLKLVTSYVGYGIISLFEDIPLDRVYLINPGQQLDVGDRTLTAIRPPTFDNPVTTGFYDDKSRAFFSSDSFGALLPEPAEDAGDVDPATLRERMVLWSTIDSVWLHNVDRARFAAELNEVRRTDAPLLLSSHLPPARGRTAAFTEYMAGAPDAQPFVGPDQAALTAMLAQMTAAAAAAS